MPLTPLPVLCRLPTYRTVQPIRFNRGSLSFPHTQGLMAHLSPLAETTHDGDGGWFVRICCHTQLPAPCTHLSPHACNVRCIVRGPAGHRGRAVFSRAAVARLSILIEENPPGCACANPPRERGRKEVDLVVTEYVQSRNPRRRVRGLLDDELLFRTPA